MTSYPGFAPARWHSVDGYGFRRLEREEQSVVVPAGPDLPLLDLLIAVAWMPWSDQEVLHEEGWFFAEKTHNSWRISLEIGGAFELPHAALLRLCSVILALQEGRVPEAGTALDEDGWDRLFGWASEGGLLERRLESLEQIAQRYVLLLEQEGIAPGRAASAESLAARAEILAALAREGILGRPQPDAIFYQLKERGCTYLHRVVDALDMSFLSDQRLRDEHPAEATLCRLSLDWWLQEPDRPSGSFGSIEWAIYCFHTMTCAHPSSLEPIPICFQGRHGHLIIGQFQGQIELRGCQASTGWG